MQCHTKSGLGQTRKIRACPLHVCFTPKPGRFGGLAELSEKGHKLTSAISGALQEDEARPPQRPDRPVQAIARVDRYAAERDGNVKRTVVPLLSLSRSTCPPSCCAKISTSRPPTPESARRGSSPLPLSETARWSCPCTLF